MNQGFWGALEQYWTVNDAPRLNRKNSWFREHQPKQSSLILGIYIGVPTVILFMVFCILEAMI